MLARWKLALIVAVLALAALAFMFSAANLASHATPTVPPATALVPPPAPYEYVPVPAGPPTDQR
jgi:hypothetical protein